MPVGDRGQYETAGERVKRRHSHIGTGVGVGLADGDPDMSGLALIPSPRAGLPLAATDGPGDVTRATGE